MFPRLGETSGIPLSAQERVTLIHKGNAIFNLGQVDLAEKVFRTARYQDGLTRVGEHWYSKGQFLRAADLFRASKFLKGEYRCYLKLGLIKELGDFGNDEAKRAMDAQLNRTLAAAVRAMMQKD
ncbi:MAG: hypothetical protein J0L75_10125 [Spirochaetes bacterium]|nr:hypothetical protein [Spirochaetota bacterium]